MVHENAAAEKVGSGASAASALGRPRPQDVPGDLARFVGALFLPSDLLLIRPIETWTDPATDKKTTRVDWRGIKYIEAARLEKVADIWAGLQRRSERERTNLFFGVCPRFGKGEQYDLAWQIRTVRVLWADLDNCTVDEALQRCEQAGLPRPSAVVRSGHGVHLYWLLAEPYLIDEAGKPPPVFKEFVAQGEGKKKKVRRYVQAPSGEKVYEFLPDPKTGGDSQTSNPNFPGQLSPKAERLQDVLAGIAAQIGGDHTQDLARLLRLPCTLNRKDQRNGTAPVPCELVECDPDRRYPLADFERFAEAAPDKAKAKEAAKIRLPRKKLTPGRLNRLNDHINRCAVMPVGERSEPDFGLCAFAIRAGLDKEAVWEQVKDAGKFAERGRDYFDRTWAKAEEKVRGDIYDRLHRRAAGARTNGTHHNGTGAPPSAECAPGSASPLGRGGEPRPVEADDDPHRLARLFAADYQTPDGPKLRNWQDDFYLWDRAAYRTLPLNEVRGLLAARIKLEFDRLNVEELRNHQQDSRGDEEKEPPTARKVTTRLVGDTLLALTGLTLLPARVQPPTWLAPTANPDRWAPDQVLACQNALVHLPSYIRAEPCTAPPTPRFFSVNALSYDFGPEAPKPSEWVRFLGELWPDDQEAIETLQEWFGYCLVPDTSQQKILMILGPRRSGKGTIARVLRALVGIDNTAGPTLASLGTNFGLWPLLGKTLAIISDARLSGRTDAALVTERLLSISGEDAQTIDRKYQSPVTCQLPTRFTILTNELPRLNDPSGALVGRMVILRQTRSWYGKEDRTLTRRLLDELPGILLWAIEGWERLQERGHFEQPESGHKLVEHMEDLSSPIGAFIRDCCVIGPGCEVLIRDLFDRWKSWCEENGKKDAGYEPTFGRDLRAALPTLDVRQPRGCGDRVRIYVGIRLRTDGEEGIG